MTGRPTPAGTPPALDQQRVLDAHFPPRGPCALCGHPDARHRLWDAMLGRANYGATAAQIAEDYEVYSLEAVQTVLDVRPYQSRRSVRVTARPLALDPAPTITLPWSVCASDNSRHGLVRGRIRLTAPYREKLRSASLLARAAWRGAPLTGRVALRVVVYAPDRRRRDVTNLLKHLCDTLTGVAYEDDAQLDDVRVMRGAVDRLRPRVELTISPITTRSA